MATSTTKTAVSYPLLKKGTPQSMAQLFSDTTELIVPKKGSRVIGTITSIGSKSMTLDISAKTEAIVADKEFQLASDYISELEVGQQIEAHVISPDTSQGRIMVSLKQLALDSKWAFFEKAMKDEVELEALGIDVNKGGLIVVVNGARGFVPSSQFGKESMGKYMNLKGEKIKVKVIEADQEKNRLIFSERHVSEATEIAQKEAALDAVKMGEIYQGVISGVMHFGFFVTVEIPVNKTVGHVEGLVHISEISWEKVSHPKDYHSVGDRIDVRVLGIDDKTGKLNLSIKQLQEDPWATIEARYEVGMTVTGTVSRVEPFGAFINVEEGVDGLIHSSRLSDKNLNKGDQITVNVESVDSKQRRMSLSLVEQEASIEYR